MTSVYNLNNKKSHLECKIFLDDVNDGVTVLRFDQVKYPRIQQFRDIQESFFWRAQEFDLSKDAKDFKHLSAAERHIFESNLFFQIMLDSANTRAPEKLFGSLTTLPEVQNFCSAWGFFESIHSFSYTWIIRNVYPNPTEVFDRMESIKEIRDRASSVIKYYDELGSYSDYISANGYDDTHTKYEHKKKIWLALMAANVLEGLRFYVSFACSWAFAERNKMTGNASIIKQICQDENVHLGFTQYLIKILPSDDADFAKIAEETKEECVQMYIDAINQEKNWTKYLFKDGSMLGLNTEVLSNYVDYIAKKRMDVIGLKLPYHVPSTDPLPWTKNWIGGDKVQVAPQEQELTSYLIGNLNKGEGKEKILDNIRSKFTL